MYGYYATLHFKQKKAWWKTLLGIKQEDKEFDVKALLDTGAAINLALPNDIAKKINFTYTDDRANIVGYGGKKTPASGILLSFVMEYNGRTYELNKCRGFVTSRSDVIVGFPLIRQLGIVLNPETD